MGSKRRHAANAYAAAQAWVSRALRTDDSLFTPGKSIWTLDHLAEIRQRFLEQPEAEGSGFHAKVVEQLQGSPPEIYQLMGEAVYFHFLIVSTNNSASEEQVINTILESSPAAVTVPENLIAALTPGIAGSGPYFHSTRPFQVGVVLEFVEQWKELAVTEQERLLADPWAFKSFVIALELKSLPHWTKNYNPLPQKFALLHLFFPDDFEGIISIEHRNKITTTFASLVTEPTDDEDRQLQQIRLALEPKYGPDLSFYEEEVRAIWGAGIYVPDQEDCPEVKPPGRDAGFAAEAATPYSVDDIVNDGCFLARSRLDSILERLQGKKNLILQGPPGTGKTWLAKRLAFAFIGSRSEARVRPFQFHPNLSYEDFVRGWRPGGDAGLNLVDGPFLRAITDAQGDPSNDYVVVIEEINRGNPAQIFGEVLTLLEADKRTPAEAVALSYPLTPQERVHIPPNFYVIGTMNVADRSLALVDLALRRRFAFIDLEPAFGDRWRNWVSEKYHIDPNFLNDIEQRLTLLNQTIAGDISLGPQFRVGHSVVTPIGSTTIDSPREWFRQVVETEIGPLLDEYWFDGPDKARVEKEQLLHGFDQ